MQRRSVTFLGRGILVIAMTVSPLAGCTTANVGGSTYGGGKVGDIASIANIESYTVESALAEARSHFRNNDFGYSAALYKRVVELSPKNPEGYVGLSASYDRLRRFDLSDRVYASLYEVSGASAQYYNNVGYSYMLRGNLTAALTNFRKARKLDPDNVVINNNLQIVASAASAARA